MEPNKNFDNETYRYFNEDTQEWIPYIEEQVFQEWGTMTNKEIKVMSEIEQPSLF